MSAKIDKISQKVIEISFYALFFLTPLLWNPYNSELFELPKMFFVWMITIIIAGAWAVRCITHQSLIIKHTPLDLPLLLFLFSQVVSYAVSIDRHTSLWGYYSRFNGGLLSTISYCILYWAFVSNMTLRSSLYALRFLLASALLVTLYAIPAHFGYDPTCAILGRGLNTACWSAQFVPTERIFGTLGQPNWLSAYLVALVPVSVIFALRYKQSLSLRHKLYAISSLLFLVAIIFTRSQSGLVGLAVAVAVFTLGYFASTRKFRINKIALVAVCGVALIALAASFPHIRPANRCLSIMFSPTSPITQEPNSQITPSSDIRCIVWKGAIDIWRHYPLFGSGPETFAFTYYNFKPPEHNLTSEWDFLYNKAHNEYLNYLANTGIFGLMSYLILIISFLIWGFRIITNAKFQINTNSQLEIRHLKLVLIGIISGYVSILVTNGLGFSVVPVQLLFFLFPAIAFTLAHNPQPDQRKSAINQRSSVMIFLTILATGYLLFITVRYYLADLYYSHSQKLSTDGDYLNSISAIRKTIELRPGEPVYQNGLADIASSIAFLAHEQDPELSAQLAHLAETASDRSLATSPRNVQSLKISSNVFITLAQIDASYLDKARESLEKAQELAPTDARIAYNLGLLYWQLSQESDSPEAPERPALRSRRAKAEFQKALTLRPNYTDAQQALEELIKE